MESKLFKKTYCLDIKNRDVDKSIMGVDGNANMKMFALYHTSFQSIVQYNRFFRSDIMFFPIYYSKINSIRFINIELIKQGKNRKIGENKDVPCKSPYYKFG